eukprot:TRINITY_DN1031_c2_g3_i1.p1 TRINITY_DN1031_c2_g3~~TRINITY_DN1031_c2_g3_i1.p1  ORF type:complete len:503 (-),score=266.20 TRINITY_DN1031_c2_g3_i1:160-1668(-)
MSTDIVPLLLPQTEIITTTSSPTNSKIKVKNNSLNSSNFFSLFCTTCFSTTSKTSYNTDNIYFTTETENNNNNNTNNNLNNEENNEQINNNNNNNNNMGQIQFSPETIKNLYLVPNVVVFINSKSGGARGILEYLTSILNLAITSENIFDLAILAQDITPLYTLIERSKFSTSETRIVIAGGDGTLTWVLSLLEGTKWEKAPIAPMPIGTGNELARSLGWGAGFDVNNFKINSNNNNPNLNPINNITLNNNNNNQQNNNNNNNYQQQQHSTNLSILSFLTQASHGPQIPLDRWRISILSSTGDVMITKSMLCFFSIGYLDSDIALKFHELREKMPTLTSNRAINKLLYTGFGVQSFFTPTQKISSIIDFEVDNNPIALPEQIATLQIFNIHSSSDGVDFFGIKHASSNDDLLHDYFQPSMSDGMLEAVGTDGVVHLLTTKATFGHSRRIAQGRKFKIHFKNTTTIPIQIDGEPWSQQGPCTVLIEQRDSVTMIIGPGTRRAL